MKPSLDRPRRTLAQTLATVLVALWPAVGLAGPPALPSSTPGLTGNGGSPASQGERPAPIALALTDTTGTSAIPVQRPNGMGDPRPLEVGPQPLPPAAPSVTAPSVTAPSVTAASVTAPSVTVPSAATPTPDPALRPIGPEVEPAAPTAQAALVAEAEPARKPFEHRGLVADLRVGTLGCIGAMCRSGGHDVTPGVRVGGFLGGNVRGWFEVGLGGGWGTMGTNVTPGTNALVLYGLDPATLQQALLAQAAGLIDVDFAGLAVQDSDLRAAQLGPSMRIHLVPRGRVGAFVGSGVGYNLLRARYQTVAGAVGLDFHGIEIPVEANLSVYVLEHLAVGLQFDYMWTWYGVAVLDHPQQRVPMPVGALQIAARQQGVDLRGQLPQLWTLGLAVRGRL